MRHRYLTSTSTSTSITAGKISLATPKAEPYTIPLAFSQMELAAKIKWLKDTFEVELLESSFVERPLDAVSPTVKEHNDSIFNNNERIYKE